MTTATSEVPEPLRTAVRSAAQCLSTGAQRATCGRGGNMEPYGPQLQEHREAALAILRAEVESASGGQRSVREGDPRLRQFKGIRLGRRERLRAIMLVVCDASRPEQPVSIIRSTDACYILRGDGGNSAGLMLQRCD